MAKCKCRYEGCCYVPVKECPIHGDLAKDSLVKKWEEEFEDEYKSICGYYEVGICLEKTDIQELFETYINGKIKIKCKDGCIQIERVK